MRAKGVRSLLEARQSYASGLTIEVSKEMLDEGLTDQLAQTLSGAGGGTCPVSVIYKQPRNRARFTLGDQWQVVPSDELLQSLRDCFGHEQVSLEYS
jgi:DNA polymerase-3 subunit alpha